MTIAEAGKSKPPTRESFLEDVISPVASPFVIEAFSRVDRLSFVPDKFRELAYQDKIVPLAEGSTLSQPMLVAQMIELAHLTGREKVLEIGTASGYSAAVLSHISSKVYTIERNENLAHSASKRLAELGYSVKVRAGDGALGIPEETPFDVIIVTAAAIKVPKPLEDQLAEGGRIVIPLGKDPQNAKLTLGLKYHNHILSREVYTGVSFVPFVSAQEGCWTEESLQHLIELRMRALSHVIEEDTGKKVKTRDEMKQAIADKMNGDPNDVDLDYILSQIRITDDFMTILELQGEDL